MGIPKGNNMKKETPLLSCIVFHDYVANEEIPLNISAPVIQELSVHTLTNYTITYF